MNFQEQPVPSGLPQLSSYTYQLSWFPKRFNLAIAFATIFLAWFLAVDKEALDSDRQLARKHMDDVRQLYATFHHSQEHLTIGRKLESLTNTPVTAPRLTVSSRLGASFMYSYNFMYRYLKSSDNGNDLSQSQSEPLAASAPGKSSAIEQAQSGGGLATAASAGNDDLGNMTALPESWDMTWSEWDPAVFEELQNLTWENSPWDLSPMPP